MCPPTKSHQNPITFAHVITIFVLAVHRHFKNRCSGRSFDNFENLKIDVIRFFHVQDESRKKLPKTFNVFSQLNGENITISEFQYVVQPKRRVFFQN